MALFILIVCSPIFLLIGIILAIHFKSSPFFSQVRNGKDGKEFSIVKFKSMTDETDSQGQLLLNEQRLTSIGRIVRKTSLDELPQVINIVKGQMSFVGPRPLPTRYYPHFSDYESQRFQVKPGITGLSQVTGRNQLQWDKRLELDVEYVENMNFTADLKIMLKTIIKVFSTRENDVNAASNMIDFDEYKNEI